MNTMYRCALAAVITAGLVISASAQMLRTFPQNTLRGAMSFGADREITLNGRAAQLAPGSRVRNQNNMIVMPGSLSGARFLVNYTVDIGGGQVLDVWVLTPDEAAIRPWPSTLAEAASWSYDASTMTWTKP
jgi:hypothetical protein